MKKHIVNKEFNVIVFDLNGTITSRISDNPAHIRFRNEYIKKRLDRDINIKLPDTTSLALSICGLDVREYYHYRNDHLCWSEFHRFDPDLKQGITDLKKLGYQLVIYTDCLLTQITRTLEILKLEDTFDLFISKEHNFKKPTPKAFEFIAKEFECEADQLLMVGNDEEKDLLPLRMIGGNTVQINNHKSLPSFFSLIDELNQLETY